MNRSRMLLVVASSILFLMSGLHIARQSALPSDIWWTPMALSPSLGEASGRVEVYVRGIGLHELVGSGRIRVVSEAGATVVTAPDVRLRFNNWDRVRAQMLPALLVSAMCLGASGVCLLLGILGWLPLGMSRQKPGLGKEGDVA